MSANGNATASSKECPVCQESFNTGVNVPKVFGVCGHSVCAVCVPGCVRRARRATCPLWRQETSVPPNGLPTNYDLKDTLESQQAAIRNQQAQAAANVQCSGCDKIAPPSDVFACKTCTASEKKVVLVCSLCGMKVHKAHEVVEHDAMAKAADIVSVLRDERQHNDTMQRHATELASAVAYEIMRLAKDCQVNVDADRALSLMTKEEHDKHAKDSSERRLRSTQILDAAEQFITRCRQQLSSLRSENAQTPGVQQASRSYATRQPKRAAPSTDKEAVSAHCRPFTRPSTSSESEPNAPDSDSDYEEPLPKRLTSLDRRG